MSMRGGLDAAAPQHVLRKFPQRAVAPDPAALQPTTDDAFLPQLHDAWVARVNGLLRSRRCAPLSGAPRVPSPPSPSDDEGDATPSSQPSSAAVAAPSVQALSRAQSNSQQSHEMLSKPVGSSAGVDAAKLHRVQQALLELSKESAAVSPEYTLRVLADIEAMLRRTVPAGSRDDEVPREAPAPAAHPVNAVMPPQPAVMPLPQPVVQVAKNEVPSQRGVDVVRPDPAPPLADVRGGPFDSILATPVRTPAASEIRHPYDDASPVSLAVPSLRQGPRNSEQHSFRHDASTVGRGVQKSRLPMSPLPDPPTPSLHSTLAPVETSAFAAAPHSAAPVHASHSPDAWNEYYRAVQSQQYQQQYAAMQYWAQQLYYRGYQDANSRGLASMASQSPHGAASPPAATQRYQPQGYATMHGARRQTATVSPPNAAARNSTPQHSVSVARRARSLYNA